jgi:hypothetical protein
MGRLLAQTLLEVLKAVAPLIVAATLLQTALDGASVGLLLQFFAGAALAIAGMVLLFAGIELGILPMGRFIGAELPKHRSLWLIMGVAFAIGFATTIAEPDVLVLADQVEGLSAGARSARELTYVIAVGVGLFVALALLRVVWGLRMVYLLAATYALMLVLTLLAPADLAPLAYDAGSVTTGVLSAPVVLALALGLSSVLAKRSAVADGFGLLGFASAGPIVALLLLGILR